MILDSIELYHDAVPLKRPFVTAFGSTKVVEALLVKLTCGDFVGWGESSPLAAPAYSPEYAAGAFRVARDFLVPLLKGRDITSGEELQRLLKPVKGNFFAKGGLDMAWHDLQSRMDGIPLWKHFGGTREKIVCGLDFGIRESISELIQELGQAIDAGYPCIKLKFGPPSGMKMLAAVRKEFPDFPFFIDCNSAYTLQDLDMFKELDRFHLMMIEQPLGSDDLVDHAVLQKQISTPICLDECLTSSEKARQAAELGSGKIFNLKPGRMGGFTPSLETLEIAARHGISCWVGGMMESSIGRARMIALASRPEVDMPSDITPPLKKYQFDFVRDSVDYAPCPWFVESMESGGGNQPEPELFQPAVVESFRWDLKA